MLAYYLVSACRNAARSGLYTAISIGGLAVGFAAAALIAIHVHDELSYDRWIPDHERIYRISAALSTGIDSGVAPSDLGLWLPLEFPQVEAVTRVFRSSGFFRHDDRSFNELIHWVDPSVFDVFRFPVVAGRLEGALARPDTVVLTRRIAEKYFGRADAVGETLLYDGVHPLEVTAVIEDLPSNTHLQFAILAPGHAAFSPAGEQDRAPLRVFGAKLWNSATYFRLPPGASAAPIVEGVAGMLDRRAPMEGPRKSSEIWRLLVRPISSIHLSSTAVDGSADYRRLYTIAAIGALILLTATINFVNLLTALGARRAVEVGVRKTAGAKRADLFRQFMTQSFVYVFAGAVLGLGLAAALLPALNAYLIKTMPFTVLTEPTLLVGALAACTVAALAAGVYPSVVLSSFRPAAAIKERSAAGRVARVRQALVVLQFAILIGLMIATVTVYRQMAFGTREGLRLYDDPIVLIFNGCTDAFRNQVLAVPGVLESACAMGLPQQGTEMMSAMRPREGESFGIRYLPVGFGFFELYGYTPLAGRFFAEERGTDASPPDNVWTSPEALVVNEAAVRRLGFASPEEAVGQIVRFSHMFRPPSTFTPEHDAEIIGVVEDFQMGSVRREITPAAFYVHPENWRILSVKLDGRRVPETLDALKSAWQATGDTRPMSTPLFFDQAIQNMYLDLRRQAQLFSVFAGIALLIALLGLVALAAEAATRRTKEIGIRKVLGGRRASIVCLLLWQFTKPVLWANVIAWPVAYYAMSAWLEGFARRVELEWWTFVLAASAALLLAAGTVLAHAYAMAGTRPVTALRYE